MSGYAYRGKPAVNQCECGCGGEVTVPARTDRRNGRVKGRPNRFINGHNPGRTRFRPGSNKNPGGKG